MVELVIKNDSVEKIVGVKDANTQEKEINTCNAGVYVIDSRLSKSFYL